MSDQKLTKAEIVDNIAETTDVSKKDIQKIIDSFFSQVKEALVRPAVVHPGRRKQV